MEDQQQERKWATPRGKAATISKNKYRDKNYDRAELALPKGMKARVKEIAEEQGQTFNGYITEAIKEKYLHDTGKELNLKKDELRLLPLSNYVN